MPTEPEQNPKPTPPKPKPPRGKPLDDGFVVFDCDGFAQMTPEQRTWPVIDFRTAHRRPDPPPADAPEKPPEA